MRHHGQQQISDKPAPEVREEVQPQALALLPNGTLEIMLRTSMVSPSEGAPLQLIDAFIVQLRSVLSGENYSNTLSSLLACVNNAYERSLG
jgi:hypothetical protein